MTEQWAAEAAAGWLTPPHADDHKYRRGVLGFVTGSGAYPGAAVIGVEAALRTGVGMVRWVGPEAVGRLVLARRPEVVLGDGQAQAWVAGSGIAVDDTEALAPVRTLIAEGARTVLDAGALAVAGDAFGPTVLTPHAGELAALIGIDRRGVEAEPVDSARRLADETGGVVMLKGATTIVTDGSRVVAVAEATPWLATAGAGDALAGILGALLATRAARDPEAITEDALVSIGATAAFLHGRAARLAARCRPDGTGGGPFTILDLTGRIPDVIRQLLGD